MWGEEMLTAEQKKLVEDNQKLIYFILNKYHYPVDDFYDLAAIGRCKAAAKFDPENGCTFSTYAMQSMWNELSRWKKTDSHYLRPAVSLDAPLSSGEGSLKEFISGDFYMEDVDDTLFSQEILQKARAKEKHKRIFSEWAGGKTLNQIAASYGCSRGRIQQITSRIRKACRAVALCESEANAL
jgi:RNA polymerase sigma factor (sigma-70 family)